MKPITRRSFLKGSLVTGIAVSQPIHTAFGKPHSKVLGANDEIRVGVAGLRSKGADHVEQFSKLPNVRVAALCDVDMDILEREVEKFRTRDESVEAYTDFRRMLENKKIDAVSIAAPNHWHSLMAIWACQAGKDVYVEKPVSHNIWEGRKLVEAARKYNRIVQAGTQKRSDEALMEVFQYLQNGDLGKIIAVHGFCYKRRQSLGKVAGPQPIPPSVDYDLWTGPAPLVPLRRESLHYDWHWVWATGNGDIGNQGIHEMDLCRWALNESGLPKRAMSIGGRFGYDDDGETANTQVAILDYDTAPIIFEVRGLPQKKGETALDQYKGIRIGIVVKCEGGYFAGGGGGGWIYDNNDKRVTQFKGDGGAAHFANFIKAVRSRKTQDLNADIIEGHTSSALCHLANISYRLGSLSSVEEIRDALKTQPKASDAFDRFQNHLFSNWINLSMDKAILGPWLNIDTKNERFIDEGEYSLSRWANDLLRGDYRTPFVVPERV